MNKTIVFFIAGLFLLCSGCSSIPLSTAGHNYQTEDLKKLVFGVSEKKDVVAFFGAPEQSGKLMKDGDMYETLYYSYAIGTFSKVDSKHMAVEFRNGRLIGYVYRSNFEGEKTQFMDEAVNQLVSDKTTKSEAKAILGEPTGIMLKPTLLTISVAPGFSADKDEKVVEVWRYWYFAMDSLDSTKWKYKNIILGFDKENILRRKEYQSTFE